MLEKKRTRKINERRKGKDRKIKKRSKTRPKFADLGEKKV